LPYPELVQRNRAVGFLASLNLEAADARAEASSLGENGGRKSPTATKGWSGTKLYGEALEGREPDVYLPLRPQFSIVPHVGLAHRQAHLATQQPAQRGVELPVGHALNADVLAEVAADLGHFRFDSPEQPRSELELVHRS